MEEIRLQKFMADCGVASRRKCEEIIDILKKEDRTASGKTANPEGLYLKNVFY